MYIDETLKIHTYKHFNDLCNCIKINKELLTKKDADNEEIRVQWRVTESEITVELR